MSKNDKRRRGLGWIYQPPYTRNGEQKRVNVWWIQYCVRGKVYRESSKSTRRQDAVNLLKKRLGESTQGRLVAPADASKVTFEHLAAGYLDDYQVNGRKSLKLAQGIVQKLRDHFGDHRAIDIRPDTINRYVKERLEQVKPATVQNELSALRRMFSLAVQQERLPDKPYIKKLKFDNTRTGFFEEPEFAAIREHLDADLQPLVEFLYLTGWRVGEVLPLQWYQVDFQAQTVRLEPGTTKNDEGRVFPFDEYPQLRALLERQREHTTKVEKVTEQIIPPVFHRDGKPIKDFRGAWEQACEKAKLPGMRVHDFRRTAVRNLERAGVSRSVAMKLTGHKTESVYRRYAIVSESDLSEGVGKLARLHQTTAGKPRKVVPMPR